ncbi:cyclic AMP-dependent transcription factor ATF-6 beta isoform X3 [Podarcis raffonei]|uniref:cyclic AMP-dependent transcription factor ATF-6 beta isoform X3 n=1 Tax=Podarcis raffonei TaxID=65483 RepID=UPI0023290F8D|nr:cyclic AMP-dependent transcription factor ATF-6 beta isoform X3 [Podarcis raffonei]
MERVDAAWCRYNPSRWNFKASGDKRRAVSPLRMRPSTQARLCEPSHKTKRTFKRKKTTSRSIMRLRAVCSNRRAQAHSRLPPSPRAFRLGTTSVSSSFSTGGYSGRDPPLARSGWPRRRRSRRPIGRFCCYGSKGGGGSRSRPCSVVYREGGRKMAALASELLLLSDSSRFRADNLLSSEDWDAGLYSCLEDDGDVAAELFPCLERSIVDGGCAHSLQFSDGFDLDMETVPPDPPWDPLHDSLFPELQVKSEPVSPASSHCSDSSTLSSSSSSSSADLSGQAPGQADVMGVKTEQPPTPPCMYGDVLPPHFGTVQISVVPAPETVPAQSVVISQSELLHLPVSGLIKVQSPLKESLPAKPTPSAPKPETKTIVPAPTQIGPCNQEIDIKVLKRQQRMIKNRESACQSRRKKKEYLQGLESRLREALTDNERLRRENTLLRRRLDCVLNENNELKFGSGNRKVICVMVLLLFIAFNFGPVSISERKAADVELPKQEVEAGPGRRHLLGITEETHDTPEEEQEEQQEEAPARLRKAQFRNLSAPFSDMKDLMLRDLDKLFLASDCRQFNRTESLRLADELSGWVRRHQINRRKPSQSRKAAQASQEKPQKKPPSPSRYVPASPPRHPERNSLSQLQVYQHPDHTEHDFMDAIDRREDTFYVVSFRRDHLLLPAISHNKTSRPKMSLVMPAMALNESLYNSSLGYEVMMQIDCEVMDTRVIHIKSSTVPPFLRRHDAATRDNRTHPSSPPAFSGRATARAALRAPRPTLPSGRRPPQRTLYLGEHGGGG